MSIKIKKSDFITEKAITKGIGLLDFLPDFIFIKVFYGIRFACERSIIPIKTDIKSELEVHYKNELNEN